MNDAQDEDARCRAGWWAGPGPVGVRSVVLTTTTGRSGPTTARSGSEVAGGVTGPTDRRAAAIPGSVLEGLRRGGPGTGAVLFPTEAVATGPLVSVAVSRVAGHQAGARESLLAAASVVATVAMLPLCFGRANTELMDRGCPPGSVPARLASWSRWSWARTALATAATALATSSHRGGRPRTGGPGASGTWEA